MKKIPSYGKIFHLGSPRTENALIGEVIVQEKVDGSQFSFGLNEDKELVFRSKGAIIYPDSAPKLFRPAIEYLLSIEKKIKETFPADTYFRSETLWKPKHNSLAYDRHPRNHIVLFDVQLGIGELVTDRMILVQIADVLDIDVIPELYRGKIENPLEFVRKLASTTQSYLGGQLIEGVVIKNYNQTILLGGNIYPLFTKYVREEFKELNYKNWGDRGKGKLEEFITGFANPNRWNKAVIHLKEKGELEGTPRDIGKLMKEVHQDIVEECKEEIAKFLYNYYIGDIKRKACHGLPQWYKDKLIEENIR